MKRGYAGDIVPLMPAMLARAAMDQGEGSAQPLNPITHMINSLEKELKETKQTLGNAVLKLVKKVKSLETALKRKSKKVLISKSEGEEPEDQGRIIQDIDDDHLVSLVRESMKVKSTDFVTPTKASGEVQEEEISPTILEAAKTLSKERINIGIEEVSNGCTKFDSEDWDAIRAKLKANAELAKDVLGKDLPKQDFAKRMVDMVNQRKKHFAEERDKAKGNKPMTQSQLRIYMSNYLKNQGTWKLSQLKKLSFEEIKEEFDKLVQQIDTFVPMDFEATKAKLKRYEEELQTKTSKKQKIDDKDVLAIGEKVDEVKEEEPVKRRKKKRSKRLGKQGQRSIYQIMRANGADTVYMSFGAMVKDFTREDLIELYRLVMQKYGTNRPEDAYDRVLWSDLRTMFDPPLNEDAIWSLPLQQKMINWRYYPTCAVHCLTLEASTIYMLADRKYPLSKDACQVMLKMKLLDGTMDEVCYQLLKMIEKQAGIRK
ncbi:hypothetical protein Tco_0241313 [Tanacetum coccineum]